MMGEAGPSPELDRLSNIIKPFNDQFGNTQWSDLDHVHRLITVDIPGRSRQTRPSRMRRRTPTSRTRASSDKALARVIAVLKDDTELFKQFSDNYTSRKWLADAVLSTSWPLSAMFDSA